MSEKKENIKNGLNVEVDDGIVVLNDVSVAEKVKETPSKALDESPEATPIVKDEPIVPDVKITPDVPIVNAPDVPLPEIPVSNTAPDFIVPTINTPTPAPTVEPVIEPTVPKVPVAPEITPEATPVVPNTFGMFNQIPTANNFNSFNIFKLIQNDNLYNQSPNNLFDKVQEGENKIFKSTSDVEKLSEEVANEVRNALNAHVVYPMKATTDLLHELYEWGENVANNGLNRKLLEEYDDLKKKYSDLESVCAGEKSLSDTKSNSDFNNFSNNFNDDFNNKSNDDYNDFGGFGGFGRAA